MAARKKTLWNFAYSFEGDKVVWIIVLMLILISIVCMFSSTSRLLTGSMTRIDQLRSQLFIVAAGLAVIVVCYNIKSVKFFRTISMFGFPLSLGMLLLLVSRADLGFIKSIEINGARRILQVGGFQVHVFEVVKVAMVMYLAWAQDAFKKGELWGRFSPRIKKIIYIYAPFLLTFVLVLPGSNSAAIVIGLLMFLVILLGGGNLADMTALVVAGMVTVGGCFGLYKASEGRIMGRIGTGISRIFENDNWEKQFLESRKGSLEYQEALDHMRQPYSAKIAVHEGGLLGKGPGQSTQRYIVPDISEDYMFSFIIEEYGLLGGILVIFLYVSLLARGTLIVKNCGNDLYAKLTVAGLCLLISGQAFLHMLVNADIGPMTGQTLPLISHGNSAFLCFCGAFGVILSLSRIASTRIDRMTKEAAPLVHMHEVSTTGERVMDDLDALDDFETGAMPDIDGQLEGGQDYEI